MKELLDTIGINDFNSLITNPFFIAFFLLILFVIYKIDDKGWFRKNVTHRKRKPHNRDPQRVYTTKIKRTFSSVCQDRCEGGSFIFRCKTKGNLQGDHWYPHANGGATTPRNLVMLCRKCNGHKSNRLPSSYKSFFLGIRRKMHPDYEIRLPFNVGQYYPRIATESRIANNRKRGDKVLTLINKKNNIPHVLEEEISEK